MSDKNISPEFIHNLFNDVHKDYNDCYKKFSKMIKRVFKENLTDSEANNIVDWAIQYKNNLENTKLILEEFEDQIKAQRLQLSENRIREIEIQNEVQKAIMPMAIVYWAGLSFGTNTQFFD